ncbi:MAG TPA: NAD-dependent epimerase/dehydratase family protein [Verrucomicrobiae bacterium]|nr:NAD-dependent epimerase/dehydratase family protein [Verrucomicrobiae bacterium]
MKKIFLTGAAGFIGSHVAKALLERGDEVIGIDNVNDYYDPQLKCDRLAWLSPYPNFHFYEGDVADPVFLDGVLDKHPGVTSICHLAAQAGVRYSLENPLAYIHSNVMGTTCIFEQARHRNIPQVVYASSSSVYGNSDSAPFVEDQNTDRPISLYAATKKSCEVIAHTYHHLFGVQSTGLRFFTVYGPWGRPDMSPIKFASLIWNDKEIDVYNHGKMQRDFTFIDDIARGVIASIDTPLAYEIINLGGSNVVELETFITTLEKHLGKQAKKNYMPLQPGDVLLTSADTTKAQELLQWKSQVSLDQGLAEFAAWFKTYYQSQS